MTDRSETGPNELGGSVPMPLVALYGLGTILGAGIYVLIGEIAATAGAWTPVSFGLAALVALVTGLSFAELSGRIPDAGGPAEYTWRAFGLRRFSNLVGWGILATGVVSAATISVGFANYLSAFVEVPSWLAISGCVAVLTTIAAVGIGVSTWFMAVTTVAGVAGLLYVIWLAFAGGSGLDAFAGRLSEAPELTGAALSGVVLGAFLAFYAFIGFEDLVHTAEEARDPKRAMPVAVIFAISGAAVFYVATAVAALALVPAETLAGAKAPLVRAAREAGGSGLAVGVLSFWVIISSALAQIIMASRVVYDLEERGGAPTWLARVNERTGTPLVATLAAGAVVLAFALALPVDRLATVTSFIVLVVFAIANAALIALKRQGRADGFSVPVAVPWLGILTSVALIAAQVAVPAGH